MLAPKLQFVVWVGFTLCNWTGGVAIGQGSAPDDDVRLEGGAEILTRGPVHEAFAEPYSVNVEEPLMVSVQPPEPIDELPPDVIPDGDNVEWIPGYWAWEDDREQFIWISGVWRDVPPGQRWVPGSWIQVEAGYQWTAGFWTSDETTELTFLPQPPESHEIGPNVPAPDDNHFWVPGTWRYVTNDYTWQPGYWVPAQLNWCWIPARYVWTPYGYVFCDGYWDYDVERRGVLFSPVFFPTYQYAQYVPQAVVDFGPLMIHLFVRSRYCHYYFGDYYDERYMNVGIVPWVQVRQHNYYDYDPLFAYYQTGLFGIGSDGFLGRVAGWHHYYQRHPDFRPRHTWAEMRAFADRRDGGDERVIRHAALTRSLAEFRRSDDRHIDLRDLEQSGRERFRERSRAIRQLERSRAERRDDVRQEDRRLVLPNVERRTRNGDLPDRPDRQLDQGRRPTHPDVRSDEERGRRDGSRQEPRPAERSPDETRPDRESERQRAEPQVPDARRDPGPAPQPRRQMEDRGRGGRSGVRLPDAPADGPQDAAPVPRPSDPPRGREGRTDSGPQRNQRETRRPESPLPNDARGSPQDASRRRDAERPEQRPEPRSGRAKDPIRPGPATRPPTNSDVRGRGGPSSSGQANDPQERRRGTQRPEVLEPPSGRRSRDADQTRPPRQGPARKQNVDPRRTQPSAPGSARPDPTPRRPAATPKPERGDQRRGAGRDLERSRRDPGAEATQRPAPKAERSATSEARRQEGGSRAPGDSQRGGRERDREKKQRDGNGRP